MLGELTKIGEWVYDVINIAMCFIRFIRIEDQTRFSRSGKLRTNVKSWYQTSRQSD